jgi:hypothetical protein
MMAAIRLTFDLFLVYTLTCFTTVPAVLQVTTDASGNTVITVPQSICFTPGGRVDGHGGDNAVTAKIARLETIVNGLADCSKQGKGYDRSSGRCTNTKATLLSSAVVANPAAHADRPYRVSLCYCHWSGQKGGFTHCWAAGHSYGGNANFQITSASASGGPLKMPFQSPYLKEPMCSVTFESIASFGLIDTSTGGIRIFLKAPDGSHRNWSAVTTWMQVICHGAM